MCLPFLIMRSLIFLGLRILHSSFPTEGIPIPSVLAIPTQSQLAHKRDRSWGMLPTDGQAGDVPVWVRRIRRGKWKEEERDDDGGAADACNTVIRRAAFDRRRDLRQRARQGRSRLRTAQKFRDTTLLPRPRAILRSTPPPSDAQGATCQKAKRLCEKCIFDAECQLVRILFFIWVCRNARYSGEQQLRLQNMSAGARESVQAGGLALVGDRNVLRPPVFFDSSCTLRNSSSPTVHEEYYYERMSLRRSTLALHAGAVSEKPSRNTEVVSHDDSSNEKGGIQD
ncbi:hypothetical protein GALMADRAFT_1362620 [Galerina marginata CBS 339.88]|uniref:Secreted protein n=1 Tax=Galerina marginata (strain CBS 339.88) TaxID=685588 RepID=A0A067S7D5_GALM3|nr:hypothetical protein GALMADRAFT_1362620 [Galerina marginata CBS 339.88]